MIAKPAQRRVAKRSSRARRGRRRGRSRGACAACPGPVPATGRPNLDLYAGRMQVRRPLQKAERHRLIESVVARKRVGTQFELIDALADAGCVVTQATVSRDIRELGLEKIVGTLAGDDTCLVVARNERDAGALARELRATLA